MATISLSGLDMPWLKEPLTVNRLQQFADAYFEDMNAAMVDVLSKPKRRRSKKGDALLSRIFTVDAVIEPEKAA